VAEHNGYNDLARMHNKSSVKGLITALLHFARIKSFKFRIPNTEPLTKEGLDWLTKINVGGRGFIITDQNGEPLDISKITAEWNKAWITNNPGPTSIYIVGRDGASGGTTLLERFPSKLLLPAIRFIGDKTID